MKKTLIALAALGAIAGAAQAQSSVTLYGIADVWFGSETSDNGVASLSQTKLNSGGVNGSRFGLMGSEDLGGGLMANFRFEQAVGVDSGASTNVTSNTGVSSSSSFSRHSWVGFSGASWGSTRFGRTPTPFDDVAGALDANMDSNLAPMNNVFRSTGGGYNGATSLNGGSGYTIRPSNTLAYYTPNFSGFSAAISYSLGEDKTTTTDAGSVTSFNAQYASGPLSLNLGYQTEKLNTTTTVTTDSTDFTRLSGAYDFGVATPKLIYGKRSNGSNSTDEYMLGVDVPFGATTLSASWATSTDNDNFGGIKRTGFGLSAKYALSKRTFVYGGYEADTASKAGFLDYKHNVLAVGMQHRF